MCRSIKTLRNMEHPATEEEIRTAALQYVRDTPISLNTFSRLSSSGCYLNPTDNCTN